MGGWASDTLSKRQGTGGWASQTLADRGEPAPAPAPAPQPSMMDRFLGYAQETAGDAVRGLNQGLYLGGADEVGAAARVAQGSEWQPAIDQERGDFRAAQERSPWAFEAARAVGSVPGALIGGARAMVPMGMAAGGLSSDSDDWRETATDAASGGLLAAGLGVAGEAVGAGAGAVRQWFGDKVPGLRDTADLHLLRQGGAMKPQLDKMADTGGTAMYAEGARRMGIGQGGKLPGTLDDYADDATRLAGSPPGTPPDQYVRGELGEARDAIVNQMGPDGMVDPMALGGRIERGLSNYPPGPGTNALRDRITTAADEARAMGPDPNDLTAQPGIPWGDLNQVRQHWGNKTNFAQGTPEATIRQDIYGAMNDELEDAISLANPGQGEQWRTLGRDQQIAIQLRDNALNRQRAEAANRVISPTDYLAAGAGGLMGAMGGYGAAGIPGMGLGTAAGAAMANRFIRGREHGFVERAATGAADWLEAGTQSPSMVERFASSPAAAATSNYEASRSLDEGRGYLLTDAALAALQSEPQTLGPYASQFAEAANSPQPGAVTALISRLTRTDPQFSQVLHALRARTGGT